MSTFACRRCGNCCRVEGYVRVTSRELEDMADVLGMSVEDFTQRFTRLTHDRRGLSLTEKRDGSCVFLGGDGCSIQRVKPRQCRDFPTLWAFEDYESICASMKERAGTVRGGEDENGAAKREFGQD